MGETTRILVFTGDGKGKTTAALGMALRAAGHGMPCLVVQFVKADADTGEVRAAAAQAELEIVQAGLGFVPPPTDPRVPEHCDAARRALSLAAEAIASGRYDLVVLDEVCYAVARGLLGEAEVEDAVRAAPEGGCIVLTGSGATEGLLSLADTVTEMRCVKHGYGSGWRAQKGVEL